MSTGRKMLYLVGSNFSRDAETLKTERRTWQEWLAQNSGKWLLFARQQTRTEADAEDVLQDALLKTWKTCNGEIREETASLVYTNIRRCAIDRARSNDRRADREQRVAEETPQSEEAHFEFEMDNQEFAESIQEALGKISPKYAEVITLKIWGEQTFAQIAEQLGESQNTVASRYRYGLENLRRLLGEKRELVA